MTPLHQLTLAALTHDLPALLRSARVPLSQPAQQMLSLATLADPALRVILEQAEIFACATGRAQDLVSQQPLRSVFSLIQLYQDQLPPPAFHQAAPLPPSYSALDRIFPTASPESAGSTAHLQDFAAHLDWLATRVDRSDFTRIYPHLLAALQRYTWCLPAHQPDVAFFDHAKLTSAIAACLYHYHRDDLREEPIRAAIDEPRCCVLVGDLSGIQDYIFDITTIGAGGVARRLRARSLYLSVLADALGHQLARRWDVPLGNVIMASGGKFYILLPNRDDLPAQIATVRREIDSWFHDQLNGEIGVNLASINISGELFQAGSQRQTGFSHVMAALSERLNREKQRRGVSLLAPGGIWDEDRFVMRQRHVGEHGVCVSCRKFPATGPDNLCDQCHDNVALGRKLPRARYIAYYADRPDDEAIPLPFGCSFKALAQDELAQVGNPYLVVKLNDPQIDELAALPGSFRYLANYVPIDAFGMQLPFDEIADTPQGRPLLGYLKADVDRLGMLFAQGLYQDSGGFDSAAHVAALSRQLDLFFSGWIQHVLSQTPAYRTFYTIFSGGDDLFLVGPWDQAAALAITIHERFTAFVGANPDLTLSAGILFTKERYPIARAAADAERMLEDSKERRNAQGQNRNQLTVLHDTFGWHEAPTIFTLVEQLTQHAGSLTSAFLYDLIAYADLYTLWTKEGKIEGLRYKPLFAYNIARNLRRGSPALYQWADELMQSLHQPSQTLTMQHLGLIATYLLFARRSNRSRD